MFGLGTIENLEKIGPKVALSVHLMGARDGTVSQTDQIASAANSPPATSLRKDSCHHRRDS
jgi:hypothetical protein